MIIGLGLKILSYAIIISKDCVNCFRRSAVSKREWAETKRKSQSQQCITEKRTCSLLTLGCVDPLRAWVYHGTLGNNKFCVIVKGEIQFFLVSDQRYLRMAQDDLICAITEWTRTHQLIGFSIRDWEHLNPQSGDPYRNRDPLQIWSTRGVC